MNWGKGIIIGMSVFIAFIVTLVVLLMRESVDLESSDYYQKEINYEQEISAMKNANALGAKVAIENKSDYVIIQIPEGDFSDVSVRLIRPDNDKLDKTYPISGTRSFLIEKNELKTGQYMVEISYRSNGKECLQKETIFI